MPQHEKSVLLISSESWGQNFVSKHHYANYLSLQNQVFFLDPPVGYSKVPFGNMRINTMDVSENLRVICYRNLLPKLDRLPRFVQRFVYRIQARRIQEYIGRNIESVWSFDPNRFWDQKVWNAGKDLYFAMDAHSNTNVEQEITKTSDLVLLVSDFLSNRFVQFGPKVHIIGHGADISTFEKSQNEVVLLGKNKVKAGLTGNFNNNVDYSLIKTLATENPDVDFIFIGPYKTNNLGNSGDKSELVGQLRLLENVFFMGAISSHELQKYLNAFDINLVLYKAKNRDVNFNPHKLMAYFYAGKVVVSSWLNHYETADPRLVMMAKDHAGILKNFTEVKSKLSRFNSEANKQLRRNYAISNAYTFKIEQIYSWLYGK